MAVEFIGVEPNSDHCPTVSADVDARGILIPGWEPDPERLRPVQREQPANGPAPNDEAIIRIPARMIPIAREACDAVERSQLR